MRVVIIGAGFAGHTAALYLGSALGRDHTVIMINRWDRFVFIPSLVWVGVGRMAPEKVSFPLKPVYDRFHVHFIHGTATSVHPDERYVMVTPANGGKPVRVDYDYLLIATGPHLDFAATPGLGPERGATYSICTVEHAVQARDRYLESVARMERGERQRIVVGVGHGMATCEGAAFEYIANIHKDLVRRGVRDKAELVYLSNEPAPGDFGVGGIQVRRKNTWVSSADFITAAFKEYGIRAELQKAVTGVEPGRAYWEDHGGQEGETPFDFAVLLPRFTGARLRYIGQDGSDVASKLTNPLGFILVDGIYGLPYEKLREQPEAWPEVYQNPNYREIFAAGIAFAPPGPISKPHINPKGTSISPAPPRTGMVSGIIGRVVAKNIVDLVQTGRMTHRERMSEMFAACIASMGDSLWDGSAAVIVVYPLVPDFRRYPPESGRDPFVTHMEMGLAGAWMKRLIHSTFMYKLQGYPGWQIIPE